MLVFKFAQLRVFCLRGDTLRFVEALAQLFVQRLLPERPLKPWARQRLAAARVVRLALAMNEVVAATANPFSEARRPRAREARLEPRAQLLNEIVAIHHHRER